MWCPSTYVPAAACIDHSAGCYPHRDELSDLGSEDEPQNNGALVLVWAGDYRRQEVWVASGANIGNWYCLGNEFFRPKVWDPPRRDVWDRSLGPARPAGTIPMHPCWSDVLGRGPVMLLSTGRGDAYRQGWRNGRRNLVEQIGALAEEDPSGGDSAGAAVVDG